MCQKILLLYPLKNPHVYITMYKILLLITRFYTFTWQKSFEFSVRLCVYVYDDMIKFYRAVLYNLYTYTTRCLMLITNIHTLAIFICNRLHSKYVLNESITIKKGIMCT
jgi:hypothetical protein